MSELDVYRSGNFLQLEVTNLRDENAGLRREIARRGRVAEVATASSFAVFVSSVLVAAGADVISAPVVAAVALVGGIYGLAKILARKSL